MSLNKEILERKYPDIKSRNEINLSLIKLKQISEETFKDLINLKEIDLSWNQLNYLHESIFTGLENLTKIYLYSNQLVQIHKKTFNNLVNLIEIDLSWNQLEQIDPQTFKDLINLNVIYLFCNQLKQIEQSTFDSLYNLNIVYLYKNQLTEIDRDLFKSLTNIREIHLSSNKIKRIDKDIFKDLKNLTKLDLSSNQLEELDAKVFHTLLNVEEIDLSENNLQHIDRTTFEGLKNLVKIYLHKNKLQKIEKGTIRSLINGYNDHIDLCLEDSVKFISFRNDRIKNNINQLLKMAIQTIRNTNGTDIYGNKYKKLNFLGGGSFGKVFKVEATNKNNRFFAMKEIVIKRDLKNNFLGSEIIREAKLLKQLKTSPHIIEYEDCFFDSSGDFFFIVTEFCADGDLEKQINKKKDLNQEFESYDVYKWSKEILLGLDFLHTNQIIHRDIKPANVFLQNGHAKLGDLGEAKCFLMSIADTFKGTFKYMSPEMIDTQEENLEYSTKTDIWAAGIIIYELVTLRYPFKESFNLMAVIDSIKNDVMIPIRTEASKQMKDLVKMMLEKDQNKRAGSKELLISLEKML